MCRVTPKENKELNKAFDSIILVRYLLLTLELFLGTIVSIHTETLNSVYFNYWFVYHTSSKPHFLRLHSSLMPTVGV